MPDYRQAGLVAYPLDQILLSCLLAVLAGAEAFTDIARFGEKSSTSEQKADGFKDATIRRHETVDGDHCRVERWNSATIRRSG